MTAEGGLQEDPGRVVWWGLTLKRLGSHKRLEPQFRLRGGRSYEGECALFGHCSREGAAGCRLERPAAGSTTESGTCVCMYPVGLRPSKYDNIGNQHVERRDNA